MISKRLYDNHDGMDIYMYTIENGRLSVDIVEQGARVNAIRVGGKDVVFGFKSVRDYLKSATYAGATVGRVANRIANGRFSLNGKEYILAKNDGNNHLHGGINGFDNKYFSYTEADENSLTLTYVSKDGEEGYPGTLTMRVKFTVADNALDMEFSAASDEDTIWSPTNHTYFNLDGEDCDSCLENVLKINADHYTPVDGGLIPLGNVCPVDGTFDFRTPKPIGKDINSDLLSSTNGYDHNYVLSDKLAAEVYGSKTGIKLQLYTDLPCMQLYTGGSISRETCHGKTHAHGKHSGFCLEPQYAPDAVNSTAFEKPILKKGEIKKHYIEYKFTEQQ